MIKRLTITFFLSQLLADLVLFSQDIANDDRLRDIVREKGQAEVTIQYPGPAAVETLSRNVSIRSVRGKNSLYSPLSTNC